MSKAQKLLKELSFILQYFFIKKTLVKRPDNIFSYPLLIYVTFNKKRLKERFLNGEELSKILTGRVNIMQNSLMRKINRETIIFDSPLGQRYQRFCIRAMERREKEEYLDDLDEFIQKNKVQLKPTKKIK